MQQLINCFIFHSHKVCVAAIADDDNDDDNDNSKACGYARFGSRQQWVYAYC